MRGEPRKRGPHYLDEKGAAMTAARTVVRPPTRTVKQLAVVSNITDAATKFRLIGDPTRMAILEELGHGECCVCDLADLLGVTQPLLSHHLRQLKDAGLIKDRKSGRWTYYILVAGALDELVATLRSLRAPKAAKRRDCTT